MIRCLIGVALATLCLSGCGHSGAAAKLCPTDAEAQASIRKNLETNVWNDTERYIWKVAGLSDFAFGPMQTGHVIQKQVEYGKNAQDVCPVRIDLSYKLAHADGKVDAKTDNGKTYLFYRNGFDEWVFKTE